MRPRNLLYPLFISLLVISCQKKGNNSAIVTKPTVADSTIKADSLLVPVNEYSYTDTFIGNLVINYVDQNGSYRVTDPGYKYFVKHISEGSLAICESEMFPVDGKYSRFLVMNIWDTGALNSDSLFKGNFYTYNTFPVKNEQAVVMMSGMYTFTLKGNTLSVSWDDPYVTIPACDFGESKGQYNGLLKQ